MADYYGTTVSDGGKIKKENTQKVREEISKWETGEVNVNISESEDYDQIEIYGYDDFQIYNEDIDDYDPESFLAMICEYMETPLIISSVGNEKCRYVGAGAWIVSKKGVEYAGLETAINIKKKEMGLY